jgi:hypothetical protein
LLGNRARRAKDSCTDSIADDYSEAEADAEYAQQVASIFVLFADGRLSFVLQSDYPKIEECLSGCLRVVIPKGFKLIAVGERCATPTDSIRDDSDPERVTPPAARLTLSGSVRRFVDKPVGVAQRSPTAINLNPFGIGRSKALPLQP